MALSLVTSKMALTETLFIANFIQQGLIVQPFVAWMHKDPTYWENPNEFDPNRFLDVNGKFIPQKEGFLPFGIGKTNSIFIYLPVSLIT